MDKLTDQQDPPLPLINRSKWRHNKCKREVQFDNSTIKMKAVISVIVLARVAKQKSLKSERYGRKKAGK